MFLPKLSREKILCYKTRSNVKAKDPNEFKNVKFEKLNIGGFKLI